MKNFEFKYNGEKYWYQRGLVAILYVFANNKDGNVCVLANKRGKGVPCNVGQWNCPCGHLDFNETLEECAVRECYEETGIKVDKKEIHLFMVNSTPDKNDKTQSVSAHYFIFLDGTIDDYIPNKKHMEVNEVEDVQWIDIDELDQYDFCFNHDKRIMEILENINVEYIFDE